MGDKFQMLQRHFGGEYYPNLENKKGINSLPCLLLTAVFLWSASSPKKSIWRGCPDVVALTAADGTMKMVWLGTHLMHCSHLPSSRLLKTCFRTIEKEEARDETSAVAGWWLCYTNCLPWQLRRKICGPNSPLQAMVPWWTAH
ncbi:unnamed protein product [Gulo gulo]|uniref:Uncharacterized protein n=1 Tax=Gulo gulo TaxID=48420 RepID=A0A9X9LDV8_GULGU|nr:unnamed protein product [Gulo gulo]